MFKRGKLMLEIKQKSLNLLLVKKEKR